MTSLMYCAADVFALPSRRKGPSGSVLEAVAIGRPVVAADPPAVREGVLDDPFARLAAF